MIKTLSTIGVLALLAASCVFAQQPTAANLQFKFTLAGDEAQAGQYSFSIDRSGDFVDIQGPNQFTSKVMISTWLTRGANTNAQPRLVFGKDGDTRYLSEIWLPNQDGIQLLRVRTGHAQEIVALSGDRAAASAALGR
jgi:hypothetical protein